MQVVSQKTKLTPYSLKLVSSMEHLEALANAIAAVGKSMRASINQANVLDDPDTADLFTGVSRDLDKKLWFVEAHL